MSDIADKYIDHLNAQRRNPFQQAHHERMVEASEHADGDLTSQNIAKLNALSASEGKLAVERAIREAGDDLVDQFIAGQNAARSQKKALI